MRAEMAAIGVEHARLAIVAAPYDQLACEVAHRLDLADRELVAVADDVPAERERLGHVAFFGRGPPGQIGHAPGDEIVAFEMLDHLPHGRRAHPGIARIISHGSISYRRNSCLAFSYMNFGQTWSRNGTARSSVKMRSSDRPIGQ